VLSAEPTKGEIVNRYIDHDFLFVYNIPVFLYLERAFVKQLAACCWSAMANTRIWPLLSTERKLCHRIIIRPIFCMGYPLEFYSLSRGLEGFFHSRH
jgi:hypothetical protein